MERGQTLIITAGAGWVQDPGRTGQIDETDAINRAIWSAVSCRRRR